MNWRWFIGDYVPAEIPLDRRARREVRGRARALYENRAVREQITLHYRFSVWRNRLILVLYLILIFALMYGSEWVVRTLIGSGPPHWQVLVLRLAIILFVSLLLGAWLGKMLMRPLVLAALDERGIHLCPRCDYWLRDLPADVTRCPECGEVRGERFNLSGGSTSDEA